jgi:hypothetical protein
MKFLKLNLLAFLLIVTATLSAQTLKLSPFHRLPPPTQAMKMAYGTTAQAKVTAWRFTAAAAGYDIINNKLLTGIGYGWNSMHAVVNSDGSSSWYTDFTANVSIYAAGNVTPAYSYGNTNVIGIGPSIGILNKLINVGYVYYPASGGSPQKSGIIANVSIPLN